MKTLKQAEQYARDMSAIHKENWVAFKVPVGSDAYHLGILYHACRESEAADYELRGAKIFMPPVVAGESDKFIASLPI